LSGRSDLATTAAIAVTAYAACDLVHEVIGHGVAAWMTPGVEALSLSSVALQTSGESRLVAAAGSIANVAAGAIALGLFRRIDRFSPAAFFWWLFGAVNLLNGTGYLIFSAALGFGDWEVVIRGCEPAWAWRAAMGAAGVAGYGAVIVLAARELARSAAGDVPRLVFTAYVAGGVLLLAASMLNPISPSLILTSGASSGFAAMAGLTLVPALVERRLRAGPEGALPRSPAWIAIGAIVGALFVGVIGRGIAL